MKKRYMIQNKKGLSAIITTLLIVLLVLVAVGIVWAVVRNIITTGAEGVELGAECLYIDIQATSIICTGADPDFCDVTLERIGTTDTEIAGVKMIFRDSTNVASSSVIDSVAYGVTNIERLVGDTVTSVPTTLSAPDSLELTPYFLDASGNEQLCMTTIKRF